MYAGTRPRHSATALPNAARSSRNTAMPISASVMMSSQLPLAPEPPASASVRSSEHPLSGLEYEPHSTVARGLAVRASDAYGLARNWSYADFHGCAPACTLPRTKSSSAALTSTPGWTNPPEPGRAAEADTDADGAPDAGGPTEPSGTEPAPDGGIVQWPADGRAAPAPVHTNPTVARVSSVAPAAVSQTTVRRRIDGPLRSAGIDAPGNRPAGRPVKRRGRCRSRR